MANDEIAPPLDARVERIERILRDYGMHEPHCPRRETQRAQTMTGAHLVPPACECWLTDEGATDAEAE